MQSFIDEHPALRRFYIRPQHIKIEVTNKCNANCTFCACPYMKRDKRVMPTDLFSKTIQEYVRIGGGALTLSPVV